MARKRTKPQPVETEDISQEIPEEEPEIDEPEVNGAISKVDAVRRALAEGADTPEDGTDYIRKTFGIEMTRQHFSSTKSQLKSRGAKKGDGKPGRKPRSMEGILSPPKTRAANGEGDLLAALEAIKPLVASLGVEKVKKIAELLG